MLGMRGIILLLVMSYLLICLFFFIGQFSGQCSVASRPKSKQDYLWDAFDKLTSVLAFFECAKIDGRVRRGKSA